MTVAILDQDPLPVIEIIPEHGIYDYECKYQKGKSQTSFLPKFRQPLPKDCRVCSSGLPRHWVVAIMARLISGFRKTNSLSVWK